MKIQILKKFDFKNKNNFYKNNNKKSLKNSSLNSIFERLNFYDKNKKKNKNIILLIKKLFDSPKTKNLLNNKEIFDKKLKKFQKNKIFTLASINKTKQILIFYSIKNKNIIENFPFDDCDESILIIHFIFWGKK